MKDTLIKFQIFLNDKGLITNHDWDFEKEAKEFIKNQLSDCGHHNPILVGFKNKT
jgi:hypothetical protein